MVGRYRAVPRRRRRRRLFSVSPRRDGEQNLFFSLDAGCPQRANVKVFERGVRGDGVSAEKALPPHSSALTRAAPGPPARPGPAPSARGHRDRAAGTGQGRPDHLRGALRHRPRVRRLGRGIDLAAPIPAPRRRRPQAGRSPDPVCPAARPVPRASPERRPAPLPAALPCPRGPGPPSRRALPRPLRRLPRPHPPAGDALRRAGDAASRRRSACPCLMSMWRSTRSSWVSGRASPDVPVTSAPLCTRHSPLPQSSSPASRHTHCTCAPSL